MEVGTEFFQALIEAEELDTYKPELCGGSRTGSWRRKSSLSPVGFYPLDESVFGVRDLAGSVSVARPGVAWRSTDARDLHSATQNRRKPDRPVNFIGIRLVAELRSSR